MGVDVGRKICGGCALWALPGPIPSPTTNHHISEPGHSIALGTSLKFSRSHSIATTTIG